MPKSRKQKTKVKKQTKRSTKNTYERIPAVSLLESPAEEDFADVSEERTSILAIVKDLEGQVDTAYQLKEILEAESLREVVVLYDYEGMSHKEIAVVLGASHAAVRKRYSRALAALATALKDWR